MPTQAIHKAVSLDFFPIESTITREYSRTMIALRKES